MRKTPALGRALDFYGKTFKTILFLLGGKPGRFMIGEKFMG